MTDSTPKMMRLLLFNFSYALVMTMFRLMVPLYMEASGYEPVVIGTLLSSHAFISALAALWAPRLVLRFPFRQVLGAGITVFMLGCLTFGATSDLVFLFAGQLLTGLSSVFVMIAAQSYVAQISPASQVSRNFSWWVSAFGVAGIIGPTLAGWLVLRFDYWWTFVTIALIGSLAFVTSRLFSDARLEGAGPSGELNLTNVRYLLDRRRYRAGLVMTVTDITVLTLSMSFLPLYLASAGLGTAVIGMLLSLRSLGEVVAPLSVRTVERLVGRWRLLVATLISGLVLLVVVPSLQGVGQLAIAALLLGITTGFVAPLSMAMISESVEKGKRALALGVRSTINRTTGTVAPALYGSVINSWSYGAAFYLCAAYVGLVLWYTVRSRELIVPQEEAGDLSQLAGD